MTAAPHKQDDGQNYATNFFPAQTLQRRREEGAGHWLVAYRKAEEQRYRNLQRRIKEYNRKYDNKKGSDSSQGNTLDSCFLLQSHGVDKPSELCSVDISEQKLNAVKPEDLKEFINVAYIDASINALSLGDFSSFPSLQELNLSLNGLCNMAFDVVDFPHLEVLNLSYNNLSADAIVSMGWLPSLKVLHLTGNQLRHLPPNLGSSSYDPTEQPAAQGEGTQFENLEVLVLDDNKLSSGVFNSLINLKRLKHLNLQGNHISEIPYLQPSSSSKPSVGEQAEEEELAHTELNPHTDEHLKRTFQEEDCGGSLLPLPELRYLNLANNKITKEEGLMAAALFPSLREIDIHSNPLTTQRKGDPPLLTYYLQDRLGLTIRRKKEKEAVKMPVKVSANPKWKLEEKIPKVSRKLMLKTSHCPAKVQAEKDETSLKRTTESPQESTQHFFVTQTADFELDFQEKKRDTAEQEGRNKEDPVLAEFPCYETLMDAKLSPDVMEPVGIQTAVRMLKHALKNPNVYRDSKPKLDSIQTPYREREKRIKKLPPVKEIKQPTEKVNEMIKVIKESTSIRELPLSRAIHSNTRQDYKEAQSLLRDMKTKYRMVHQKTMEQLGSIESERNTNKSRENPPPLEL
ncbi:LOW QUALITY PROTEIN: X-ray radiation resistance-associated protein 1 [Cheilinus undulatus]|uniref:LOW QUALITY PROTEIN: X-ray radiation resistance-associated protein 1 n=1 Tax=Cheilinus undulatus TaxID=241271 RepID=UPI001BD3CFF2|nr:LOW QUALITY PROTEIN: X-ray radiation resistance-associated protein 1 [Cheilinus undulatus]